MRISVFLLLASILQAYAYDSYSQITKISLDFQGVKLTDVFDEIENKTEFYFLFNEKLIDTERKVNVSVKNKKIDEILVQLFKGTDVVFTITDRKIILAPSFLFKDEQQKIISGKVTDENGEPIIGATVFVKGTSIGTTTDVDGNYSLNNVPADGVLVFSYVGMKTIERNIDQQSRIDVSLEVDSILFEDVVVTALGIRREKKALGYSVGEVDSEAIIGSNEKNIVSALSGKVAGVAISTSSGQPGGAARITIRGNSSINYNNQPLFVVDGIPYDNSASTSINGPGMNTAIDIDPNIIENLTILKGASASALYGSRAANGVVLITTKTGSKDRVRVNYSLNTSIDKLVELPLMTSWAQGEFVDGVATYYDGDTQKTGYSWGPRIEDLPGVEMYDKWAYFQNGHKIENSFDIRGGTEKTNYFMSATNLSQQGLLQPIKFGKNNLFFKMNADVNEWLTGGVSFQYSRTDAQRLTEGLSRSTAYMAALMDMPVSWNPYPIFDENGVQRVWTNGAYNNPNWMLENTLNTISRNRFLPIMTLDFKLADNLSLNTKVGLDAYTNNADDYVNSGGNGGTATGVYNIMTNQYFNLNSDIMLNYNKQISDKLSIDLMVGNNVQSNRTDYMRVNGKDFIIPNFKSINNTQTQTQSNDYSQRRSVSAYGQAVISYDNMLYYTFTGRNDWSSTLPPENNSYFYPSNSIGFIFSELFESNIVSFGKLRAAYSMVGNDAPPYSIYTNYELGGGGGLTFPYQGIGTFAQSNRANNTQLKNEMTKELEFGLEMIFFNDRFGFETSIYDKSNYNQIVSAEISNATGYSAAMLNIGEMENKGVELLVYGTPVSKKSFKWDISINWSANRNKVIKITDAVDKIDGGSWGLNIWEGYSYPVVSRDYNITDENGNDIIVDDPTNSLYGYALTADKYRGKEIPVGNVSPDWRGGIRNTISYHNFTLSAFLDMMFGGVCFNMNEQYTIAYGTSPLTEERPENGTIIWPGVKGHVDQTTGELIISGEPNDIEVSYPDAFRSKRYKFNSEYVVQKTDYIKLREVSIRYKLPYGFLSKSGFIENASVFISGTNLWRWLDDGFTGSDPEFNLQGNSNAQGMSIYMMPSTKSYNFGINLSF